VWSLVREANKYIDETKPWELAKIDQATFEDVMKKLLEDLARIASLLIPFLPETAEKIQAMLEARKGEILFQRIK
jgi:methionyl-tRNA synthetase